MPNPHKRPMPEGFASIARSKTFSGIMAYYQASYGVAKRWVTEAGVTPKQSKLKMFFRQSQMPSPARIDPAEMAADYLRRFMPISRCTVRGTYSAKGDHWRAGTRVMTPRALMELEARYRSKYAD